MKKFTNKKPELPKTEMKDKIINFDQVEKMRVAIYEPNERGEYCCEVDFHFSQSQPDWDNQTSIKLRNNLYKLNNIAYKMPSGFESFEPFYQQAIDTARQFKKHTRSDFHNKLGKRFPDRYYTIAGTYVSYDPVTQSGILQITQPELDADDNIDVTSNYACIEFELDQTGKGLRYTWISEE